MTRAEMFAADRRLYLAGLALSAFGTGFALAVFEIVLAMVCALGAGACATVLWTCIRDEIAEARRGYLLPPDLHVIDRPPIEPSRAEQRAMGVRDEYPW